MRVKKFFFFLEQRSVWDRIDDVANENKGGFRYVFVGEERQRVLVTQRKLKLKTLGDWEIVVAQSKDIEHTKLSQRRRWLNLAMRTLKSQSNNSGLP